jgi:hypothetical protein
MKLFLTFLVLLCLMSCTPILKNSSGVRVKAIYLVQGEGEISKDDLNAHPEIFVTDSFEDFKDLANSKVALWIDVNAANLVDSNWLKNKHQEFYTIVLVGNGSDLCSFGYGLYLHIQRGGPLPKDFEDYCNDNLFGYSISKMRSENSGVSKGFSETPTVKAILEETESLLKYR